MKSTKTYYEKILRIHENLYYIIVFASFKTFLYFFLADLINFYESL